MRKRDCLGLSVLLLSGVVLFGAGREDLLQAEQHINVASYNPTQPEVQLDYAATLTLDESGTISMDSEAIQGYIKDGLVTVDAVKGLDTDRYYVMEKGGYLISILAHNQRLESTDGKQVQIHLVEWLYGRNGLADHEGFKSNIVPKDFLPKTGLEVD